MFRAFATLLAASGLAIFTQWENRRFDRVPILLNSGQKALRVIQALRSLNLHPYHEGTNQLTQQEIAKMDYIISVDEFHAELKHSPAAVRVDIPPAR